MGTKLVLIDSYVEWPVGTNRSNQFTAFNAEPVRAEIEASVFGDKVEKVQAGTFTNTLTATVRPDADMVFQKVLINQLNADADIAVLYRPKSGAKGATNPEMTFSVAVTKIPSLGGNRNTLMEGQLQLRINTAITWDDGTTPIVIGG